MHDASVLTEMPTRSTSTVHKIAASAEPRSFNRLPTGSTNLEYKLSCTMPSQVCFQSLQGLSLADQNLVSRYGRGPIIPTPYSLIHEAFENIVDAHPEIIAANFGDKSITYQQLDLAANRLCHHLIESGLKPKQRVCLIVQRSMEMLVGILAVLKAGCQYVPIDGGVVSEQALEHIFSDTEAHFLLCLPQFWDKVRRFAKRDAIIIALGMDVGAFYPSTRPNVQLSSSDGAYAIYTSGRCYNSQCIL